MIYLGMHTVTVSILDGRVIHMWHDSLCLVSVLMAVTEGGYVV